MLSNSDCARHCGARGRAAVEYEHRLARSSSGITRWLCLPCHSRHQRWTINQSQHEMTLLRRFLDVLIGFVLALFINNALRSSSSMYLSSSSLSSAFRVQQSTATTTTTTTIPKPTTPTTTMATTTIPSPTSHLPMPILSAYDAVLPPEKYRFFIASDVCFVLLICGSDVLR